MSPFRLAVHNEAQQLLGYWWLREHEGVYAMTCRHPITREFKLDKTTKPAELVRQFYNSYVSYLEAVVNHITRSIHDVPDTDCLRPGFRKHHYRNVRRDLISRRAQIICRSRQQYTEAITVLRERGWPSVPPPPCFHVDIAHAAASTRTHN